MTQYKVTELVHKLDVMDGRIAGLGTTVLNFQKTNTARSKEFYCIYNYSFNFKFIPQLPIKNYLLTALRTSSRWPSTPPNIAIQTSVLMFHNLKA